MIADVKETWDCYEPDRHWRSRRRYGNWDDRDDDAHSGAGNSIDEYEFGELIDSVITLDCWIDASGGKAEPVVTGVGDAEVCASTPSDDLQPYASEHEGYMGNYGNTMDRWYRRAALVIWPRRLAFAVRAGLPLDGPSMRSRLVCGQRTRRGHGRWRQPWRRSGTPSPATSRGGRAHQGAPRRPRPR